jgi:hypothetical protein
MAKKTGRVATADSYDNFVARVGMQQPNQHAASTYGRTIPAATACSSSGLIVPPGLLALLSIRKRTI